jgi:hypothetical protein
MLQGLRSLVEGHERLAEVLDARYLRLTELAAPERLASIVVFDQFYRSQRYDDARLTPNDENRPSFLLPKGRRTHGRRVTDLDQVYVRRS